MTNALQSLTPAGAAQARLTLEYHVHPNNSATNVSSLFVIPDAVDVDRFAAAVESVVTQTPALNESFDVDRDGKVSRRTNNRSHVVERAELASMQELRAEAQRRADESIDPGVWPLLHTTLYKVGNAHYFFLCGSHAVVDGFGAYLAMQDAATAYLSPNLEEWVSNPGVSPADLPPVPVDEEYALDWFRTHLPAGPLSVPEWEAARRSDGVLTGSVSHTPISAEVMAGVEHVGKQLGVSNFSVLLAAELLTLRCLTASKSPVVSVPLSGRRAGAEYASSRGALVNVLPFSVELSLHEDVGELIVAVHKQMRELMRVEHLNVGRIREALTGSDQAIPSGSFTYYPAPFVAPLEGDQQLSTEWFGRRQLQYPLALVVAREYEGATLRVEQSDQLAGIDVASLYCTVLEQIISTPDTKVSEVAWQTPASVLESHLAPTDTAGPSNSTLVSRWNEGVRNHPDRIAIRIGGESHTYEEVDLLVRRLSAGISAQVEGPLVGVAISPSVELIATLLAVMSSGKAYVPLDVQAPQSRVETIVQSCGELPTIVRGESPWSSDRLHTVDYDTLDASAPLETESSVDENSLAYVIFTSGSTGTPKGVPISHRNVVRLLDSATTGLEESTWTLFHSYAFDFSVWEIFGSLLTGGRLVIPEQSVRNTMSQYVDLVVKERVDVLNQTPSGFALFLASATDEQIGRSAIRKVIFGGEALHFDQLRRFRELKKDAELINMYGITETTVHTTEYVVRDDDLDDHRSIIGRPLSDMGMMVLDSDRRIVPVGVTGELGVYGPGVTDGYLNRPDLTQERIVEVSNKDRVYLTGDMGYLTSEGYLVYLGRRDHQVQVRGHRIELGEIEWALRQHPEVEEAAVVTRGSGVESQLIAFVVASNTSEEVDISPADLAKLLPAYMIPHSVTVVESLPTTINGKIDRAQLAEQSKEKSTPAVRNDETDDSVQSTIRTAWADLLDHSHFTDSDKFFDVGGNSQLAVSLIQRLRVDLNQDDLAVVDLFEYNSVEDFAAFFEEEFGSM